MSWRGVLTAVLLLAAVVSGWSAWRQMRPQQTAATAQRPDFVLHDFELVALGDDGRESFTLRGPVLQQDAGSRALSLATPLFLVPDDAGAYWHVRAERGHVPAQGRQLQLRGRVEAISPAEAPPPTRIETDRLDLFPKEHRATSDAVVTLTRPGLTMQGRGLQAAFDRRQVTILSDLHARYVPTPR